MRRQMRVAVVTGVALAAVTVTQVHAAQAVNVDVQPIAAYSLAAPKGESPSGLVARAIVPGGTSCPRLVVLRADGTERSVPMTPRRAPATTGGSFSAFTACSADIPARAVQARVGTAVIPAAMPTRVTRMAIFGDTGCRLKGSTVQDCSTQQTWPLARISSSIANDRPDLILFTGDFFYREAACPDAQQASCAGSPAPVPGAPFKDTAYSWAADVFTPMSPLFSAAPIVVTRGNHEACNRGGNGYFLYFDPREGTEGTCAPVAGADGVLTVPTNDLNPTYAVDVRIDARRSLRLVVVDSAYGWDCDPSALVAAQRTRYVEAQRLARGRTSWLVVHRPIVGWQPNTDCSPTGGWISADQAVASTGLLGPYQMMLSSHIHAAEAINIPGLPGQLVIGNGGTLLEEVAGTIPSTGPSFPGASYPGPSSSWFASRFGYVLATPGTGKDWVMHMRDPQGTTFATCTLAKKRISCVDRPA